MATITRSNMSLAQQERAARMNEYKKLIVPALTAAGSGFFYYMGYSTGKWEYNALGGATTLLYIQSHICPTIKEWGITAYNYIKLGSAILNMPMRTTPGQVIGAVGIGSVATAAMIYLPPIAGVAVGAGTVYLGIKTNIMGSFSQNEPIDPQMLQQLMQQQQQMQVPQSQGVPMITDSSSTPMADVIAEFDRRVAKSPEMDEPAYQSLMRDLVLKKFNTDRNFRDYFARATEFHQRVGEITDLPQLLMEIKRELAGLYPSPS